MRKKHPIAVVFLHVESDIAFSPELVIAHVTKDEVQEWKGHTATIKQVGAYSMEFHDYRCHFLTIELDDQCYERYVASDFRQDASTLVISEEGIEWRGHEKHSDQSATWRTERVTFDTLDRLLARAQGCQHWAALCDLWNELADVPLTEDGVYLDGRFIHFPEGTEVHTVWHWFEAQHADFVVGEAGKRIGGDHPFKKLHQD